MRRLSLVLLMALWIFGLAGCATMIISGAAKPQPPQNEQGESRQNQPAR